MHSFIRTNKNLITYSLILIFVIPIFGFKLLISFLGNIFLLLVLIPLLLLLIAFISFNSLKSNLNTCKECGAISIGLNDVCLTCGAYLEKKEKINHQQINNPSERTIEVEAEEIK